MQVRRFHTKRKNVNKAPVVGEGRVRLHSVTDGKAIFQVGDPDPEHVVLLFISPEDLWVLQSVRDIMKAEGGRH